MASTKRPRTGLDPALNEKCINTIRCLAADVVQKANSGHPGAPMGLSPVAHALWTQVMRYSSSNPKWPNRDRFVLSNGHACALQYIMLHLAGYDLTMNDLKSFRQVGSKTPGHPECHLTHGVEVSTGPLGQGISNAVGIAFAESHLAAIFNKPGFPIIDNTTFVICGDGCMQEGISSEAGSLAGHLGLGKLIVLYDDNSITIDGETKLSFTEDVCKRYEAYGWQTLVVDDGNNAKDQSAILRAIEQAKAEKNRPTLIKVRTIIGFGSHKQGTEGVHGSPLGPDEVKYVKKLFGFNPDESFVIPDEVAAVYHDAAQDGRAAEAEWNEMFARYAKEYPDLAAEFQRRMSGRLPDGWEKQLPTFKPEDKAQATRKFSQLVLEKVIPAIPEIVGGSADLTPSTLTLVKGQHDYQKETPDGRYLRYGVREHAMAAFCNGAVSYGGLIPFASTFLNFTSYCLGAVRLSALSHVRVLYIMTHDSIGLGEDGPTHQPIEIIPLLRAIPNMLTLRPADGNETSGAYKIALSRENNPSVLCLSRQECDNLPGTSVDAVARGAYVIQDTDGPRRVILTATGSEVQIAVKAAAKLKEHNISPRVVSFPSWELFNEQPVEYRASVFPAGVPVLSIEASSVFGWERYSHAQIGMRSFGSSGPWKEVYAHFGITVEAAVTAATKLVDFYPNGAPDLIHVPQIA